MKYIKFFNKTMDYDKFILSDKYITPNVSAIKNLPIVYYNPYVKTYAPGVIYIEVNGNPEWGVNIFGDFTDVYNVTDVYSKVVIDEVEQPLSDDWNDYDRMESSGIHTVELTLKDPTKISDYLFLMCGSIEKIHIPNTIEYIGKSSFNQTSLTTLNSDIEGVINIPNNVKIIEDNAFGGCYFTTLNIPDSVTYIGDYAFYYCNNLININMSNNIEHINDDAFSHCDNIESITIASTIQYIGWRAFDSCTSLESVTILATTPPEQHSSFINCPNVKIYVPSESLETYKTLNSWSEYDIYAIS